MHALEGLKVIELGHYIAGPHCTQILAANGAEVVKVEPPIGDVARYAGPFVERASIYFAVQNRNKKSISLDLKLQEGRQVLDRLIRWADVLVTNYLAGVPERLGFGYEHTAELNPRLVMVHITGFGLTSPRANDTSYDGLVQSMSGLADMTGQPDGPPSVSSLFVGDHVSGLQGAIGVLLGLAHRERTGRGQLVDLSMLDGLVAMVGHNLSQVSLLGGDPHRAGNKVPEVLGDVYPAKEGWVYLQPLTNRMWRGFCEVLGKPEWTTDPRFGDPRLRGKEREYIDKEIIQWTTLRTRHEIVEAFRAKGVPCGPVNSVADLLNDSVVRSRGMIVPVDVPGAGRIDLPGIAVTVGDPVEPRAHPALGADTEDVLSELGYDEREIENLRENNVVRGARA